jgi:hypothetical protein
MTPKNRYSDELGALLRAQREILAAKSLRDAEPLETTDDEVLNDPMPWDRHRRT